MVLSGTTALLPASVAPMVAQKKEIAPTKVTAKKYYLHEAIKKNDMKSIKRLVEGRSVKVTELDEVCARPHCNVREPVRVNRRASAGAYLLLSVDAGFAWQMGWTPLMTAVTYRLYDVVKYLVDEAKAPLDAPNNVRVARQSAPRAACQTPVQPCGTKDDAFSPNVSLLSHSNGWLPTSSPVMTMRPVSAPPFFSQSGWCMHEIAAQCGEPDIVRFIMIRSSSTNSHIAGDPFKDSMQDMPGAEDAGDGKKK